MDYRALWGVPSESFRVLWKPLGSIWDSKSEPGQFHKPNADCMTWKERSVLFILEALSFLGAPNQVSRRRLESTGGFFGATPQGHKQMKTSPQQRVQMVFA